VNSELKETTKPVPKPIPIPRSQRSRDVWQRFVPALLLVGLLVVSVALWKKYASAPTLLGQAEVVSAP
jgi:hypothetical protein